MQSALNEVYPIAFSIFEPSAYEAELAESGVFAGEKELEDRWIATVTPLLEKASLVIPEVADRTAHYGGRRGYHTTHLGPLLAEMTEVFRIDPAAEW
jgi:ring-1,2-phenylacetyl-CoA epoxidase subunit PaaC